MNKKTFGYLFAVLVLWGCVGVCEDANAETITIVDGKGHSVNVSTPVLEVVSISSRASEVICAFGASDRIVGRDSFSVFPPSLEDVPIVAGGSYSPNVELILEREPDLVIADSMLSADNRETIEDAGIPVVVETAWDPTTIDTAVSRLGILLDKEDEAGELINFMETYQEIINERVSGLSDEDKPAVFFEWQMAYYSMGNGTLFHNLTTAAGGMNIAAEEPVQYPTLSPEWVVERDPDVIVRYVYSTAGENLTKNMVETRDDILARPELAEVKAIKDNRVYILGDPVASGIRSLIGELYLAKWFNPALFEDIDPEAVHRELLQNFFGQELVEVGVYP
jgi:iron complex transport system substrate-binding protein